VPDKPEPDIHLAIDREMIRLLASGKVIRVGGVTLEPAVPPRHPPRSDHPWTRGNYPERR
jgi:hypothetical protein